MIRKKKTETKGPSQRQLRMAEQIRHILSEALRSGHFRDPALKDAGNISITSVDVSPDLKNANAYVMPLGGKKSQETINVLNKASGFFRLEMGKNLEIRHTPKVSFKLDNSFDEGERVNKLLINERKRLSSSQNQDEE